MLRSTRATPPLRGRAVVQPLAGYSDRTSSAATGLLLSSDSREKPEGVDRVEVVAFHEVALGLSDDVA